MARRRIAHEKIIEDVKNEVDIFDFSRTRRVIGDFDAHEGI